MPGDWAGSVLCAVPLFCWRMCTIGKAAAIMTALGSVTLLFQKQVVLLILSIIVGLNALMHDVPL